MKILTYLNHKMTIKKKQKNNKSVEILVWFKKYIKLTHILY